MWNIREITNSALSYRLVTEELVFGEAGQCVNKISTRLRKVPCRNGGFGPEDVFIVKKSNWKLNELKIPVAMLCGSKS